MKVARVGCWASGAQRWGIPRLGAQMTLRQVLTDHGQRADAGFHRAAVLLLQPRTLQQPRGGLEKLHHDGLVGLKERAGGFVSAPAVSRPRLGTR